MGYCFECGSGECIRISLRCIHVRIRIGLRAVDPVHAVAASEPPAKILSR
jgi:hypothetical protein